MKKILNNLIAVAVVLIVFLIIVPLPAFMLDVMYVINITLSLMILLITMYIKETLEFSVFPSILLITTLFRLGLNISSTRLILTKQGEAGQVIKTFGSFVLSGNIVVGFIVFLIIVLVQFIVITKGAERVAEVSARFTLDAMPGKQMAIDADLSSGLIDEQQAKIRRENIQREAEFFGSMDGATKFVKGDAIMSIIITFINFIGGTIIGMVQGGASFTDVLHIYSIATVGDGLVAQIPALLISTATGMIVTRAASQEHLSTDITRQFMAQPISLIISGIAIAVLGLIPGMPWYIFIPFGALLAFMGYKLIQTQKQEKARAFAMESTAAPVENAVDEGEYYRNIDNVYNLLQIDSIEMEFGYSLLPLIDERSGSSFIERLVMFRRQFALEMGAVVPEVRLRDNGFLNPNQYIIKIKGEEIAKGEILVDYYLALDPGGVSGTIDGIDTIEPAYGIPSKWITQDKKELAEIYGYTVIDPLSVVITHLSEVVKRHAHELLSRQDVNQLLDTVRKYNTTLVDDVVPNIISFSGLQKILANLLKEGVPIRDIETILETLSDYAPSIRDTELLTEYVRQALKRTITRKWSDGGQIRVITLDSEVEKVILNAINKNDQGTYLALDPQIIQKIVSNLLDCIAKVKEVIQVPIILTSPVVRIYFSRMLEQFYQDAVILSFNEIDINVQIQALANVTLD
ncbi:flagellar biosynthesis protein FlhA [Paludicola sp. MB14-C6]|uniref:flagellar biosynthesis protein FlhA n=1 Tax=Paludihabitans sp. MB14-C6 TaxID=3070656 RepID=UPI0027DC422C|nr:flagellar biosynthesis protein FlhA [Paludicola sp. MB14-C6]WMJ24232.1 flagellar biosynthesis protein FlhA [Paludicola sp. MB14-C6]